MKEYKVCFGKLSHTSMQPVYFFAFSFLNESFVPIYFWNISHAFKYTGSKICCILIFWDDPLKNQMVEITVSYIKGRKWNYYPRIRCIRKKSVVVFFFTQLWSSENFNLLYFSMVLYVYFEVVWKLIHMKYFH